MPSSTIIAAWNRSDTASISQALEYDATFRSPYADYRGRDTVAHILDLVGQVLEDVTVTASWGTRKDFISAFTAEVGGQRVDGILREASGPDGLAAVWLFLRPFAALQVAIGRMAQRLRHNPTP